MGVYDKGCFFDPLDANELAEKMAFFISGTLNFDLTPKIKEKVLIGWAELFDKILEK